MATQAKENHPRKYLYTVLFTPATQNSPPRFATLLKKTKKEVLISSGVTSTFGVAFAPIALEISGARAKV